MRLRAQSGLFFVAIAAIATLSNGRTRADMIDMTGVEPQDICAECHGLDGAGNHLKFPRLAGQKPEYIVKQLNDFRAGRRKNDGGQMVRMATELEQKDIPRVADWFSKQEAPRSRSTIDANPDITRAKQLATAGAGGTPGCLSCHSASSPYLADRPIAAPRLAGQYDYFIAKQLTDFREGRRDNDADGIMRRVAQRLTDAEILSLAVYLSQNPELHEAKP